MCVCQEPSKAPVAGSLPKSSRRCTSQLGGKTRPFQASPPYHSLGDRCIVLPGGRQLDRAPLPAPSCSPHAGERVPAGPPCTARRPRWSLALPELWTTPARRVSFGGMKEAGCRCTGAFIFIAMRGKTWRCPMGPESSRNVAGMETASTDADKAPRLWTLPRGLPLSAYLALTTKTTGLSLEVSHYLVCETTIGPTEVTSAVSSLGELFRVWLMLPFPGRELTLSVGNLIHFKNKNGYLICIRQMHFPMPAEISSSRCLK